MLDPILEFLHLAGQTIVSPHLIVQPPSYAYLYKHTCQPAVELLQAEPLQWYCFLPATAGPDVRKESLSLTEPASTGPQNGFC